MAGADKVHHPIFARLFASLATKAPPEQFEHRRLLVAGLAGRVIEVGAGNGLNFPFYPAAVTEVVAVEPESYLREKARAAAAGAPVPVTVVDGLADALPAADSSFDAGVASLVLCSVADQPAALAELRRVIRPGGELRFYEHVLADEPRLARRQQRVDRLWPHLAGGCHPNRDTPAAIEAAGFEIERCDRFRFRPPCFLLAPIEPHVLGVARRT